MNRIALGALILTAALALPAAGAQEGSARTGAKPAGQDGAGGGKAPVYLEPQEAGPDYRVQGEYAGEYNAPDGRKGVTYRPASLVTV